jgi:hypothetical protein
MPSDGILAETIEAIQDIAAKEIATVLIERASWVYSLPE